MRADLARECRSAKGVSTLATVRTRFLVLLSASIALVLAACGSSGSTSNASDQTTTTTHATSVASKDPSVSAKMICATEAQTDIYESATGVKTIAPFKPTWIDHLYSCKYVYPAGASMTLSVKEVSTAAETTAYFDSLATKLHKTSRQVEIGEGAFQVQDGSVVVRKDFKVLLVDITKLPAQFGVPLASRGDVAITVAGTIMSCWTGA
jgi:hypothetical protein